LDDRRKRIIIAEIENWRRNNLLPEHYCIFLLNLYTEGDCPPTPAAVGKEGEKGTGSASASAGGTKTTRPYVSGSNHPVSGKMILAWLLGACLLAGMILLAFHFNRFTPLMQIAIFTFFVVLFYILAFIFRRSATPLPHLLLGLSSLLLIFGGVYILNQWEGSLSLLLAYLAVVCLLWCASAFLFGYEYLLYCGLIGLSLVYGVATLERVGTGYAWWRAELYWVPIACLMTGFGFLLHGRHPKWAGVLAVCGMIIWFGAEIQSLYIPQARQDVIQLLLFVKVFASSVLFFLTRSYWFQWLRL
jgi:hypothetical protein